MLSLFKSNNPGVVIFYLFYIILFRVCFAFIDVDTAFVFEHNEPLSFLLFGWLKTLPVNYKITGAVLSGILCFVQALFINGIINNNKLTARKNYLGGLIFIIYASFFKEGLLLSPASIALTFIIIATSRLFQLIRKEKSYVDIFDVGFLIAIAALFYFPSVLFIIFGFIGLATVRSFSYREWAAELIGFIVPFFLAFTWYFYMGHAPGAFAPRGFLTGLHFSVYDWIQTGAIMLCAFASFGLMPGLLYSSSIQVRKFTTLMALVFLFTFLTLFMQQKVSLSHWVLLSLPVGIITCMVLSEIKNRVVSEVIHLMLILLVLEGQFLPLFKLI